ncbi:hypothetical protein QU38_01535, partial [Staphylococcus aureus]
DELGPALRLELERVEQAVDMLGGLGAALGGEARRLVEHQRRLVAVAHQAAGDVDLLVAELDALALRPGGLFDLGRLGRRHADHLALADMVARLGARAVDAQLAGARPARDGVEAGVRHVPLEPAIEPDAVVIGLDQELADGIAHG